MQKKNGNGFHPLSKCGRCQNTSSYESSLLNLLSDLGLNHPKTIRSDSLSCHTGIMFSCSDSHTTEVKLKLYCMYTLTTQNYEFVLYCSVQKSYAIWVLYWYLKLWALSSAWIRFYRESFNISTQDWWFNSSKVTVHHLKILVGVKTFTLSI